MRTVRLGGVREEVVGGRLPHLALRWPTGPLVAGVTTRALNFGRHTAAPAHAVAAAHAALRAWSADRFAGLVGGVQVHGARLFRADGVAVPEPDGRSGPFTLRVAATDGFVAATPGLLLTIGVADCVPAFLYAPEAGAVALVHAGWRGVAAEIVPGALAALSESYGVEPGDCAAYWGPAIGPECYPVGEEVVEAIRATSAGPHTDGWVIAGAGGPRVDLRAALTRQARAAGIDPESITASVRCTACDPGLFHSYRRERGGGGRMVAFAGVPGENLGEEEQLFQRERESP